MDETAGRPRVRRRGQTCGSTPGPPFVEEAVEEAMEEAMGGTVTSVTGKASRRLRGAFAWMRSWDGCQAAAVKKATVWLWSHRRR